VCVKGNRTKQGTNTNRVPQTRPTIEMLERSVSANSPNKQKKSRLSECFSCHDTMK
jgi:hypothetical protein